MISKFLLKMRRRFPVSEMEELDLRAATAAATPRFVREDDIIVPEGRRVATSCLLVEGFACRSKLMENGNQPILEIEVPGDFMGLHSYVLERLDHDITALTPCTVVEVPHESLARLVARHPGLGHLFWFATLLEGSIHREWIASLGERTARQRIAHLFCEMYHRLSVVGLVDGTGYAFPLTQEECASATGLTGVHVNRMLRRLANEALVTFRGGWVEIHDLPRLEAAAGFMSDYLFLDPAHGSRLH